MEYDLIDELEDALTCPICYGPAIDPLQEQNCGRLFCGNCIQQWRGHYCPICRNVKNYFQDTKSEHEIKALRVKCNNKGNGCHWVGTIGTLQDHLTKCDFMMLRCPNGCSNQLRKDMLGHLTFQCPERLYRCPDCCLEDKYRIITGSHADVCENKIVCCVNEGCEFNMERKFLEKHVRLSCNYSVISCTHAIIGCNQKMIRMKMADHEEDREHHFPLALNKVDELTSRVQMLESIIMSNEIQLHVIIKISDYTYKKQNYQQYNSEPFFTSLRGYKMCLQVYANGANGGDAEGSHLSVFLMILPGPCDSQLDWPMKATFSVGLLNQLSNINHFMRTWSFSGDGDHCQPGGGGFGFNRFIELNKLGRHMFGYTQYLKDDTLYFRVTSPKATAQRPWLDYTHN